MKPASTSAPAIARPRGASRLDLGLLVAALVDEVAADEDEELGGGSVTPSAYETAWVARVRDPQHADRLAFPASLTWLLQTQRPDGSWDCAFPYSLIPTMAALVALRAAPDDLRQSSSMAEATARAERYLRRAFARWRIDSPADSPPESSSDPSAETFDTPFFEFLIPQLATELAELGVTLPVRDLELMEQRRTQKLARVPLELLYTGQSNLIHALEAFGPLVDYRRLRPLRAPNGGYGYSPSATAAALIYGPASGGEWDESAARWLRSLSARAFGGLHGAMPTSHPADTFEAAWVLHLLLHGDVSLRPASNPSLRNLLLWLRRSLSADGASFARTHALPCDADDTAVTLAVLNRMSVQTPLDALWRFEAADHFVSYVGERTSSTSANAHALEALLSVDAIGDAVAQPTLAERRAKIVGYLLRERRDEGCWRDKWHLSPYYATMKSVLALAEVPDPTLHQQLVPTLAWLCRTQRPDGGWGWQRATVEESAYGVLTLRGLLRIAGNEAGQEAGAAPLTALARGRAYLRRHFVDLDREAALPALWVDKTLYAPPRVIRAAVLAALHS